MMDQWAESHHLEGCVGWPREVAKSYRESGFWTGETLGDFLEGRAQLYRHRVAVVDERSSRTYFELNKRASVLAQAFQSRGIQKHDRVIIQLSNCVEWFEVCFSLFRIGAIPVVAQPAHREFEIGHFLKQTAAVAYVAEDSHSGFDFVEFAEALVKSSSTLRHVFIRGRAGKFTSLSSLLGHTLSRQPPVHASEVALLQLSGGSAGAPKLIPRTHADYLYSIRRSAEICRLNQETVSLVALPISHNFPLSSPGALGALHVGGKVVLSKSPTPDCAFPWVKQQRPTITGLVPSLARLWLDAGPRHGVDLSEFSLLQVGGAKVDEALARRLQTATKGKLQQVFGMAEGLVNYTLPGDPDHLVLHTQGRPMSPGDQIAIVDDEDKPVDPGEVGHLLTRGPYTVRGYYKAPRYNESAFTADGYYRTGDRVKQTAEGYLIVEGRAKDQINRGGEKISAQEVEIQLRKTGLVDDVALLPVPDSFLGERSCAVVVCAARKVQAEELWQALKAAGLATYKLPDRFVFVEALPKTAVGKTDKPALLALLHNAESASKQGVRPS
jgi:2,3-dihydroxybenzoate-AMP ligase